jgi:predicted O-methyltransferase YrrM
MTSPLNDPVLEGLLDRLHAQSDEQAAETSAFFAELRREGRGDRTQRGFDDDMRRFLADKFVALDRDKATFCYQLCRALGARRVVEAGTSYGVSTLYLAAAVRDNGHDDGAVIATEYEPAKAAIARANFSEAGLDRWIELREGDLRETLVDCGGPVDFLLVDIWHVALDALELVAPALRPGAVVVTDNTLSSAEGYGPYFEFLNDPANKLRTMTLPFTGGLEFTVRVDD